MDKDRLDRHQVFPEEQGLAAIKTMRKLHRTNREFPDKDK
jgi:hypothetical protein